MGGVSAIAQRICTLSAYRDSAAITSQQCMVALDWLALHPWTLHQPFAPLDRSPAIVPADRRRSVRGCRRLRPL